MSDEKPFEVGTPVRDSLTPDALARLPERARDGVWGEPTFNRFVTLYRKENQGDENFIAGAIASMLQDADGKELLTAEDVGRLPMTVGLELSGCVKLLDKIAAAKALTEEVSDPKE